MAYCSACGSRLSTMMLHNCQATVDGYRGQPRESQQEYFGLDRGIKYSEDNPQSINYKPKRLGD